MSALPLFGGLALLTSREWKVSYRHEDGDLVGLFYEPVLCCSTNYDRMTGYFSASALALAARGLNQLLANGGRMRLIVGCTLEEPEANAIAAGYDLRSCVEQHLQSTPLEPPDIGARQALETLAQMIASGFLDIKVAIPVDPQGRPVSGTGIYHEKVGILSDAAGNQLAFSGSINETANGWFMNRESFQVSCSWCGPRDAERVTVEARAFARFWENRSTSVKVFDFPEAAKARLLEFLPKSDRMQVPMLVLKPVVATPAAVALSEDERRRILWSFVRHAAELPTGLLVGERTAAVSAWPHQLANFVKFIRHWPSRLLVADEVGLGKTITTGLILRQAWISRLAKRILILTPASLLVQWQNELYEKFNLNIPIYNGQELVWRRLRADDEPRVETVAPSSWAEQPFVLASSQLVRRKERRSEVLSAAHWDLIVLDEAHHARRKGGDGPFKPNTLLSLFAELKSKTASLLLLTATPMQVQPVEVWDLLSLLGMPGDWNVPANFLRYFEAVSLTNPSDSELEFLAGMFRITEQHFGAINSADLRGIIPEASSIMVSRLLKALRDKSTLLRRRLSIDERKLALRLLNRVTPLRYLMARQTRHLLREYYRLGRLSSRIASRDPRDIEIELTAEERSLYTGVEAYIRETYKKASPEKRNAVGFIMTIYRRRLASSFYALQRTLNGRLERIIFANQPLQLAEEDLSLDEAGQDEILDPEQAQALAAKADGVEETDQIKALLKKIALLPTDSKAVRLLSELQSAAAQYDSAIIFTQYADTMHYLRGFLEDRMPSKRIACYSGEGGLLRDLGGTWSKCSKEQIKRDLKAKKIDVLICTDAAGEGLNLQFCGLLFNYDLPWNPMKVEQRIGRIDRIGQAHETIRICNLAYRDTVEADVYFTVGQRINLFQGIVGKLQPILAKLPKKFEEYTLSDSANQDEARHRLMSELEDMKRSSDESAFDIELCSNESFDEVQLPVAALDSSDIDHLLSRTDTLPRRLNCRPLDNRSYAVQVPGTEEEVRVTTDGEVFSYCSDSQLLFSYGSELFETVLDGAAAETDERSRTGVCWIVDQLGARKFLLATNSGLQNVQSFGELRGALLDVSSPQELPSDFEVIERVI